MLSHDSSQRVRSPELPGLATDTETETSSSQSESPFPGAALSSSLQDSLGCQMVTGAVMGGDTSALGSLVADSLSTSMGQLGPMAGAFGSNSEMLQAMGAAGADAEGLAPEVEEEEEEEAGVAEEGQDEEQQAASTGEEEAKKEEKAGGGVRGSDTVVAEKTEAASNAIEGKSVELDQVAETAAEQLPALVSAAAAGAMSVPATPTEPSSNPVPDLQMPPPTLDQQAASSVEETTSMAPEQHSAQIQGALSESSRRGRAAQSRTSARAAALSTEQQQGDGTPSPEVQAKVAEGNTRIGVAYQAAQTTVSEEAAADGMFAADVTAMHGELEAARVDAVGQISSTLGESKASIQADGASWLEPIHSTLETCSEEMRNLGSQANTEAEGSAQELANEFRVRSNDPMERALNEARAQAAPQLVSRDGQRMERDAVQRAEAVMGEEEAFHTAIGNLTQPMLNDAQARAERENTTLTETVAGVKTHIETEAEGSAEQVRTSEEQTTERLELQKEAALVDVEQAAERLGEDAQAGERDAGAQINEAASAADQAMNASFQAQAAEIDAVDGFVPWQDAQPHFAGFQDRLEAAGQSQISSLEQASQLAEVALEQHVAERLNSLEALIAAKEQEADGTASAFRDQVAGVSQEFKQSVRTRVDGVRQSMQGNTEAVDADLAAYRTAAQEEMQQAHQRLQEGTTQHQNTLREELVEQVSTIRERMQPGFEQAAQTAQRDISDRSHRVNRAMAIIGTNSSALLDALRGLTIQKAQAVEHLYEDQFGTSLQTRLREELCDPMAEFEEVTGLGPGRAHYRAAMAYLQGNTTAGAAEEIEAAFVWYNDDEARVETVLRSLDNQARERLRTSPQYAEVRTSVSDHLDGDDLAATEALLGNNLARADAVRLRQRLEAADDSITSNADTVLDLLQDIDPQRREAIRREFQSYDQQVRSAGGEATEGRTLQDVAHEVLNNMSAGPEGAGFYYGATDVATDLVVSGRDSDEVAASRFQMEERRPGGPDWENLERSLFGSQALQDAMHSSDPEERAQAQEQAAARRERVDALINERYANEWWANQQVAPENYNMEWLIENRFRGINDQERGLVELMHEDMSNTARVAQAMIEESTDGAGTDEGQYRRAVAGMSEREIGDLASLYGGREEMYEALGLYGRSDTNGQDGALGYLAGVWNSEVTGDAQHQMEDLMVGRVENDEQRLRLDMMRYQRARGSGAYEIGRDATDLIGQGLGGDEGSGDRMDAGNEELRQLLNANGAEIERSDFANMSYQEQEAVLARMREEGAFDDSGSLRNQRASEDASSLGELSYNMRQDSETYRAVNDSATNTVVQGVTIAGGIAASALTAGTASPLLAMAVAGGTSLTGMGVREAMQGSRYGRDAASVDLANSAANAASSGLGATSAFRGLANGAGSAVAGTGRWGEIAGASLNSGVRSGMTSSIDTSLRDRTWEEGGLHGVGQVLNSGARATATGLVSGAVENRLNAPGTSLGGSALRRGGAGAASNMSRTAAEYGYDQAQGTYRGNLTDQLAQSGAIGLGQGLGEGAADRLSRSRGLARRVARNDPDDDGLDGSLQSASRFMADSEVRRIGDAAADPTRLPPEFRQRYEALRQQDEPASPRPEQPTAPQASPRPEQPAAPQTPPPGRETILPPAPAGDDSPNTSGRTTQPGFNPLPTGRETQPGFNPLPTPGRETQPGFNPLPGNPASSPSPHSNDVESARPTLPGQPAGPHSYGNAGASDRATLPGTPTGPHSYGNADPSDRATLAGQAPGPHSYGNADPSDRATLPGTPTGPHSYGNADANERATLAGTPTGPHSYGNADASERATLAGQAPGKYAYGDVASSDRPTSAGQAWRNPAPPETPALSETPASQAPANPGMASTLNRNGPGAQDQPEDMVAPDATAVPEYDPELQLPDEVEDKEQDS